MQIRVNVSIDVTKIEKERLYKGAKGTYLNLTTYLDLDEKDQYGKTALSVSRYPRKKKKLR